MLHVENLKVAFRGNGYDVTCVDGVDFTVAPGEVLGLVGESGCGKSVTALAVLGLLGKNGRVSGGRIMFEGQNLVGLDEASLRRLRGSAISMVFQEPMTSLNPVMTVGAQLIEPISLHLGLRGKAARELAVEWLSKVGIPRPNLVFGEFPFALSGGMRQRVMIAAAMVCSPKLLIADEPTTALDVTIQKQILDLVDELRASTGTAVLLITHDLGVVAERADRVAVMYAGKIIEEADVYSLFESPTHPYTKGLLSSVPDLRSDRNRLIVSIPGNVPSPGNWPSGCSFRNRCPVAQMPCENGSVPFVNVGTGHRARCLFADSRVKGELKAEETVYARV